MLTKHRELNTYNFSSLPSQSEIIAVADTDDLSDANSGVYAIQGRQKHTNNHKSTHINEYTCIILKFKTII